MANTNRHPSIVAFCTILSIAIAIGVLNCSAPLGEQDGDASGSGTPLGEADIQWGDVEGLLLSVMEEDVIGSAAYYGTTSDDGSEVTLTGFDANTGAEEWSYDDMDPSDQNWLSTQLIVYEDMVLAKGRQDPALYVLDCETGSLIREIALSA